MIEVVAAVVAIVGLMWGMGRSPHRSTRRFVFDIALYLIGTVVNIFAFTHHEFFLFPTLLMALFLVLNVVVCILHLLFPVIPATPPRGVEQRSSNGRWSKASHD